MGFIEKKISITEYTSGKDLKVLLVNGKMDAELPSHCVNSDASMVVIKGEVDINYDDKNHNIKQNEFIFVIAQTTHHL